MSELSKFIKSVSVEVNRSAINLADYNPRFLTEEAKKTLKKGIKRFGLVGGIVVNKRTGMTLVSGHQRLTVMDELQKYNPETKEGDYKIRVDVIDVDGKAEKELNVLMNNPNAQGQWDYDKLAEIVPDIDYEYAGLTQADLSMIGVDYLFQTEDQTEALGELEELNAPIKAEHEDELKAREAEREQERQRKIADVKEMKRHIAENASRKAEGMDAYVMLSFDTYRAKAEFNRRFGYQEDLKFIKGEDFSSKVERVE